MAPLYLGKREGKDLVYMGKVGTGWSRTVSSQIRKQLDTVVSPKSKLTKPIKKPKAVWVEPTFTAEVEYRDVTSEGLLRASSFIRPGEWFVVGGQMAYIASAGDEFVTEYDRKDRRLRVIYDNATESNVLARSLQKALYRDGAGRRITNSSAGSLFGNAAEGDDLESGTIYVLRSKSELPEIAKHRELIHKIGVTGGSVETRITQAAQDPTYLLAGVEIVATYKLFNINRTRLENIFHRLFGAVRLDLAITDRFGQPVKPKEWFLRRWFPRAVFFRRVNQKIRY